MPAGDGEVGSVGEDGEEVLVDLGDFGSEKGGDGLVGLDGGGRLTGVDEETEFGLFLVADGEKPEAGSGRGDDLIEEG